MISEGRNYILFDPWLIAIPGTALFLLLLAVNLLGDGVRVGGVDLVRVVATPVELPDILVGDTVLGVWLAEKCGKTRRLVCCLELPR